MGRTRVRRFRTIIDETRIEIGREIDPPVRYCAAAAVVENPCAGRYFEDLAPLLAVGAEMGDELGRRALAALGIAPGAVQSYGKAAIVGEAGEREHAAAVLHPTLGKPLRAVLNSGAKILTS